MREPRDPDEPQLIVESLRPQAGGPRTSTSTSPGFQWRMVSRGLWVVLALLIVVAASAYFHTMPTAPPSPSPAGQPGVGWIHAGPAWARTIVFAASAPATAYTCGMPVFPAADLPEAISVGVSHNGGHTWQALDTPAQGVACDVSVNPTDARDVMLTTNPCSGCVPLERGLYRSLDGGSHWRAWTLPPRVPDGRQDFAGYFWAWVGATLFLAPNVIGEASFTRLATSVQGQPFAWVDPHALYPGSAPDSGINALLATRSALEVSFVSDPSCRPGCDRVMEIGGDGASWSQAQPAFAGHPVQLLAASGDGTVLFGQTVQSAAGPAGSRTYVRSHDGGATWQALPSLPRGLIALTMLAPPDGALYAELYAGGGSVSAAAPLGVYKLAPGTTAWTYRAPFPEDVGGPLAIALDGRGHPLALWGGRVPAGHATWGGGPHWPRIPRTVTRVPEHCCHGPSRRDLRPFRRARPRG